MNEPGREAGRRSRLEIVCDILQVVSDGHGKPTRIMQLANLTWNDLLAYLGALLEGEFLTRTDVGNRFEYEITRRGREVLSHFARVKEELAPMHLETIFSGILESPRIGGERAGPALLAKLTKLVREKGYTTEENKIRGKSGVIHYFDCIASDGSGSRHAFLIRRSVSLELVVSLFVLQLDTDLPVTVYYSNDLSDEVKKLARAYALDLQRWPK
jgi:predicted transcriptional regulator